MADLRDKAYRLLAANDLLLQASREHRERIRQAAEKIARGVQARGAGRLYLDPSEAYRYVRDKKSAGMIRRLTEH